MSCRKAGEKLSGHYSRDLNEYVNVIGVISFKAISFCRGATLILSRRPQQRVASAEFLLQLQCLEEEDERATTNVQNGLVFVFLFSFKKALILRNVLGDKL